MAQPPFDTPTDDSQGPPQSPATSGSPQSPMDTAVVADLIAASVAGQHADPDDPGSIPVNEPTDPDSPAPGTKDSARYNLSGAERDDLAHILCRLLDDHDTMMEERWARLDRCMANYNMVVDTQRTGDHPFAAQLVSEMTKATCDQAKSRLSAMILNTRPLIKVSATDPHRESTPDPVELAESIETFMEAYTQTEIQIGERIPLKILSAVQVGTAVTYDMWEEEEDEVAFFNDEGKLDHETVKSAGIRLHPIHYRDFIFLPVGVYDWQRDYQVVGHHGPEMTRSQYEAKLSDWGLSADEVDELTAHGHTRDSALLEQRQQDKVDPEAIDQDHFRFTELWIKGAMGPLPRGKHQVFLDRERERVLFAGPNPLHCRLHPYWPFHYKRRFNFAFSEGVAEELLQAQAIDSTIDNMEVDNWKVAGNNVGFFDENRVPDTFMSEVYPGGWKGVDGNPGEVISLQPMGGPVDALTQAKEENNFRAMRATGLPPVLTGAGDPTMKSGADATSIMALISEAGRKFGDIDQGIKECFSHEAEYWLELIAQYAPLGMLAERISPARALPMEVLKFVPPRGRIQGRFRIEVMAPSPSSNREVQKQNILVLSQMADNTLILLERYGMEIYSALGQQEQLLDLKRQLFRYKLKLWEEVTKLHEIPGLVPIQPQLEPPTPEQERIDQLRTQLVQLTQEMGQMRMVLAFHMRVAQLQQQGMTFEVAQKMAESELQQAQKGGGAGQSPSPGGPGGSPGGLPGLGGGNGGPSAGGVM